MGRTYRFNFKSLDVYQAALQHFDWCLGRVAGLRVPFALKSQFLTAPLSVMANVAEANGRDRKPGETEQHYRYAQGSTYECAAHLDALAAIVGIADDEYDLREENLARIAAMLSRLMQKQARRRAPVTPDSSRADPAAG